MVSDGPHSLLFVMFLGQNFVPYKSSRILMMISWKQSELINPKLATIYSIRETELPNRDFFSYSEMLRLAIPGDPLDMLLSKQFAESSVSLVAKYLSVDYITHRSLHFLVDPGGGYSQKNWVGVCGPLPKTLTLFMTKNLRFSLPYLWY